MKIDIVRVGQRLATLRELKGSSLSAAAESAGIAKSYLAKLERGEIENPGLKTLDGLARSLGVTLGELLRQNDAPPPASPELEDYEQLLHTLPTELQSFITEMKEAGERLPADVVRSLASIQFRGKRPQTVRDWRFIYDALTRAM